MDQNIASIPCGHIFHFEWYLKTSFILVLIIFLPRIKKIKIFKNALYVGFKL